MEWLLVAVCGLLWVIYSVLKRCLATLGSISSKLDISNGLLIRSADEIDELKDALVSIDKKIDNIDDATGYFHNAALKATSRY